MMRMPCPCTNVAAGTRRLMVVHKPNATAEQIIYNMKSNTDMVRDVSTLRRRSRAGRE